LKGLKHEFKSIKKIDKKYLYLLIAVAGIFLDQITKLIARQQLEVGKPIEIINKFFYLHLVFNEGAAWSMFSGRMALLSIISLIATGILGYLFYRVKDKWLLIAISLALAGTIGNLIDRAFMGKVTDFFDFIIFGYDFPVFNIADMLLNFAIGVYLIYCIVEIINEKKKKNKTHE